jgi:glucan phosphorylase
MLDEFVHEPRVAYFTMDIEVVKRLAGDEHLNMTRLALNLSEYVNGVAKRHAEVSKAMFPGYRVHAITNGVHPHTWTAESFRALYDKLETVVLPLYYGYGGDPGAWIKVMKGAISKNASYFNSHRMMRRYATEAYIR